jgi:hypothetical protein
VYSLISDDGGLPTPADYGLVPGMMHTACWRGFYLTYLIRDEKLVLDKLTLRAADNNYPPVNGVSAVEENYNKVYQGLNITLPYSGKMVIGRDFIQEKYIHMGFQPASSFRVVVELNFETGICIPVSSS